MLISMLDACIDASQVVSRNHVHGPRRSFERVPTTEIEYIEILIAILNRFTPLKNSIDFIAQANTRAIVNFNS
ncbi:hypothetical protein BLOT_005091 [Blomia tropicalis]|nr:hypothetical protein BLOT_005091 [Blomia tropicalis]